MTETKITSISKNYAKALVETAQQGNLQEEIKNDLHEIFDVFNSSNDLSVVMENSSISTSSKIEIIDEIFKGKINEKVLNFLKILVEKNRFNELGAVINSYDDIMQQKSNKKYVEIISPIELNFETRTNVLFKLEKKLNCEIIPRWSVDKSIIAGLMFKFDDYVIDTSIRTKLESLSKSISR